MRFHNITIFRPQKPLFLYFNNNAKEEIIYYNFKYIYIVYKCIILLNHYEQTNSFL